MNGRGFVTISMHELERVKIIEAVVQHRLTMVLAAERLLLWAIVQLGKPLSSLTHEDLQLFRQFLKDPLPRALGRRRRAQIPAP
ncbi:hypothetical protein HDG38_005704 [Paraburkholderia sp. WSM4177]|nr:hypothetical protein [Paraburkholderia sp. WSM4177]MBB5487608.1 hypothetical protein [Paraburkholderia sp. WSM4180]